MNTKPGKPSAEVYRKTKEKTDIPALANPWESERAIIVARVCAGHKVKIPNTGSRKPPRGVGSGGLAPKALQTAGLRMLFVIGVSESCVTASPHNNTAGLIKKTKEVMGPSTGTSWQGPTGVSGQGSRWSSPLTAIFLYKFILHTFLYKIFLLSYKRIIFSCVVLVKKKISKVRIYRCHPVHTYDDMYCNMVGAPTRQFGGW